ncbi:MAG: HAD family phosphatase [Nanoarchaeota archaeon]
MVKAFIFDMDGVLVNSEKIKADTWKVVLVKYGVLNGDEWYEKKIGTPGKVLAQKAIEEFSLPIGFEELFHEKHAAYLERLKQSSVPIESTINFLKSIPKEKFKIAISSSMNRSAIESQMTFLGLYELFDAVTSGLDEVEKDKPHPDIYLLSAKKLNTPFEECIVIEDSSLGVESAKRAGMKCIGFISPCSGNQDLSKADLVINNLNIIHFERLISFLNTL